MGCLRARLALFTAQSHLWLVSVGGLRINVSSLIPSSARALCSMDVLVVSRSAAPVSHPSPHSPRAPGTSPWTCTTASQPPNAVNTAPTRGGTPLLSGRPCFRASLCRHDRARRTVLIPSVVVHPAAFAAQVDDSALNRLVLRRLVHAAGGSSVVEASCGQSAYAACKASSFPLVLMDLNM